MTKPARQFTRRELFQSLFREPSPTPATAEVIQATVVGDKVAIIQGRFCLAYQKSFCSVCSERCPIEGAIEVAVGIPQINPQACTGCGICAEVCPAPKNAILMHPKRKSIT